MGQTNRAQEDMAKKLVELAVEDHQATSPAHEAQNFSADNHEAVYPANSHQATSAIENHQTASEPLDGHAHAPFAHSAQPNEHNETSEQSKEIKPGAQKAIQAHLPTNCQHRRKVAWISARNKEPDGAIQRFAAMQNVNVARVYSLDTEVDSLLGSDFLRAPIILPLQAASPVEQEPITVVSEQFRDFEKRKGERSPTKDPFSLSTLATRMVTDNPGEWPMGFYEDEARRCLQFLASKMQVLCGPSATMMDFLNTTEWCPDLVVVDDVVQMYKASASLTRIRCKLVPTIFMGDASPNESIYESGSEPGLDHAAQHSISLRHRAANLGKAGDEFW
ncbi:hypothetical protein HJFPF1_02900 [Paramyrothecium foliicola]|nr:hypothetical protein HJFPF1_02900 [Paramyrothecium foliicola]